MIAPVPVLYVDEDLHGNKREWLRLIYVDLLRAYEQASKYQEHQRDTGYQTLADYAALRTFLSKHVPNHEVYYTSETQEVWIEVTTPNSPAYRTSRARWNAILRQWPSFIDEEARLLLTGS